MKSPQVDVWAVSPAGLDASIRAVLADRLDAPERERLSRFVVPSAGDSFLISRALLRVALSARTGEPAKVWRFAAELGGRPIIAAPTCYAGLGISISHTNSLIAAAVSDAPEIGIDVEDSGREFDILALAPLVLAEPERYRLDAAAAGEKRRLFTALWTLKEAYLKARGCGLLVSPASVWFNLDERPIAIHRHTACRDMTLGWQLQLAAPTRQHLLAIAVRSAVPCEIRCGPEEFYDAAGLAASGLV